MSASLNLRGEVCNLTDINGVRTLVTLSGVDLIALVNSLSDRVAALESSKTDVKTESKKEVSKKIHLQDITDVDVTGLSEGCVLVYRKGKWRVELIEE